MKRLGAIVTLISIFFILGCNFGSAPKNWPPISPAKSPIAGFKPSASYNINGWTYVYKTERDARSRSRPIGMAYLIKEGNFELPFNLFAIEAPDDTYVESQFEVLYFDDQRTQIHAVEEKGDKIAIIKGKRQMSFAFTHPGAKVRCGKNVYELHADGWYLNGSLVHSFSAKPPSGRKQLSD